MPLNRDPPSLETTMSAMLDKLEKLLIVTTNVANQNATNYEAVCSELTKENETTAHLVNTILKKEPPKAEKSEPSNKNDPPLQNNPRPPRIFLPTFDGSNPLDWIFQAKNYFSFYSIPPPQRLAMTVIYFTGAALSWYKNLSNNNLLGTWADFKRALELRFGPSSYENHEATLFKLRQTTTVAAYQAEFEQVSNCVNGLSPTALRNCFISGLRSDIQAEIALHQPHTLHQTYGLAKLIEDKLSAHRPRFTYTPRSVVSSTIQPSKSTSSTPLLTTPSAPS